MVLTEKLFYSAKFTFSSLKLHFNIKYKFILRKFSGHFSKMAGITASKHYEMIYEMIYKLQFKIFLHGSPSDIVEDIMVNLATISISLFSNGSWENLFITQRRLKITVERKLLPNFFLSSKLFMFEN